MGFLSAGLSSQFVSSFVGDFSRRAGLGCVSTMPSNDVYLTGNRREETPSTEDCYISGFLFRWKTSRHSLANLAQAALQNSRLYKTVVISLT